MWDFRGYSIFARRLMLLTSQAIPCPLPPKLPRRRSQSLKRPGPAPSQRGCPFVVILVVHFCHASKHLHFISRMPCPFDQAHLWPMPQISKCKGNRKSLRVLVCLTVSALLKCGPQFSSPRAFNTCDELPQSISNSLFLTTSTMLASATI